MQAVVIDSDKLRALAAEQGIDKVTEFAEQAGVSRWVLYRALETERIQPSHALAVATALGVEVEDFQ